MNQKIYNLEEFASRYNLKDIFGAYAAHFAVTRQESGDFADMVTERALFCRIFLVKHGCCRMVINGKDGDVLELGEGSMLMVPVNDVATLLSVSPDIDAECVLVDEEFVSQTYCFRLSADKYKSVLDIFHFIRDIVRHQHINKIEMIRSMFNVLQLIIEELPYEQCSVSHDIGHKKGIYEIFLHHLYRNFRKERQIRFYADKLNVSPAYLSRLVKEISGSTINEHATSLVYKEICNLLTQTDMSMGEIAAHLNFSDQSAMTNFFKQRSGMSPLAYRNK